MTGKEAQQREKIKTQYNKSNKRVVIQNITETLYIMEEPKSVVKKKIETKYQGAINAGLAYGISEDEDVDMSSVYIDTVHGILVSKYLFAGEGVGFYHKMSIYNDPQCGKLKRYNFANSK